MWMQCTPSSSIGRGCNTGDSRLEVVLCVAVWLLRRLHGGGRVGKGKRFDDFAAGSWTQLHGNAELDTPFT